MIFKYFDSIREKALQAKAEQYIKDTEQQRINQGMTNLTKASYERLLTDIDWCIDDTKRQNLMEQLHRLESDIAKERYSFNVVLSYGMVSFSKGVKSFTEIV